VLLRVLETRRVIPLGSMVEEAVDIGLVCASHHPLRQLVSRGMFRADLFFRLSGMTVVLPPLRERSDFEWVVRRMLAEEGRRKSICVAPESFRLLRGYSWPGNLRQLRNVLRLCVAMLGETGVLTPDLLPAEISEPEVGAEHGNRRLQAVQVQAIQATLERHGGNISAAARELGITRTTLYRKLGAERPIAAAGS
jgi:transcriptional regulator of acetoin/glycerol metabolism